MMREGKKQSQVEMTEEWEVGGKEVSEGSSTQFLRA
jgi:hypothetical protein